MYLNSDGRESTMEKVLKRRLISSFNSPLIAFVRAMHGRATPHAQVANTHVPILAFTVANFCVDIPSEAQGSLPVERFVVRPNKGASNIAVRNPMTYPITEKTFGTTF
jgi:hypothetical protein